MPAQASCGGAGAGLRQTSGPSTSCLLAAALLRGRRAGPRAGAPAARQARFHVAKVLHSTAPADTFERPHPDRPLQGGTAVSQVKDVPEDACLKIVGLGKRGVSAVNRLMAASIEGAEFWALDSCSKALGVCGPSVRTLQVAQEDDSSLGVADLQRMVGHVRSTPEEAGAGVVFVLGSALGSPGGATLMLQLVNHLRRRGFFVAVALTRPFEFEGARKLEQAAALIEAMQDVANLVVVVEQDVLTKASSELTIGEASAIADNTLEYTVRSVLWSLRAPEILKLTNSPSPLADSSSSTSAGLWSFLWHGRDLRRIPRLLFPPMMALLTCPGYGTLGRGQAAIPMAALQEAGLASAFSTLAEDAVKAASESPFLDSRMPGATAVLCVLRLPSALLGPDTPADQHALGVHDALHHSQREHAIRSAVQVAAMAVRDLAGPRCTDIIVCPQLHDESLEVGTDGGGTLLSIEASLLVIGAIEEAAASGRSTASSPASAHMPSTSGRTLSDASSAPSAATAAARLRQSASGAGSRLSSTAAPSPSTRLGAAAPNPSTRLNNAATVISPGSTLRPERLGLTVPESFPTGAAVRASPTPAAAPQSSSTGAWGASFLSTAAAASAMSASAPPAAAVTQPRRKTDWSAMSALAGGSTMPAPAALLANSASTSIGVVSRGSGELHSHAARAAAARRSTASLSSPPSAPFAPAAGGRGGGGLRAQLHVPAAPHLVPRLEDSLVTSLVAQSLDLPPRAAKWRHQQRAPAQAAQRTMYSIEEAHSVAEGDTADDEGGGAASRAARAVDVRARAAGMLDREREPI